LSPPTTTLIITISLAMTGITSNLSTEEQQAIAKKKEDDATGMAQTIMATTQ
jgi:hypothetical protein